MGEDIGAGRHPGAAGVVVDEALRQQLAVLDTIPFYRDRARQAGVDLTAVRTDEDFRALPLMTRTDLETAISRDGWQSMSAGSVTRLNFTPSHGVDFLAEPYTRDDLDAVAQVFADVFGRAGFLPSDVVQIVMSYHVFAAARIFDEGFARLGATVLQAGAIGADQQLALASAGGTNALMGNASFMGRLGEAGLRGVTRAVSTGEPFSAIAGRREHLKAAFEGELSTAIDTYGISECFPAAAECVRERGMHVVDEHCVVEILDPDTREPLEEGESGEVVLTHRAKQGMPLLRFRTGDLGSVVRDDCSCGRSSLMPDGVNGRVDEMYKVKGVKLYPDQLAFALAGVGGVDPRRFRLTISRRGSTDTLALSVVGDEIDTEAVQEAVRERCLVSINEIVVVEDLEEGPRVNDRRVEQS